jgi:hypothetical protein
MYCFCNLYAFHHVGGIHTCASETTPVNYSRHSQTVAMISRTTARANQWCYKLYAEQWGNDCTGGFNPIGNKWLYSCDVTIWSSPWQMRQGLGYQNTKTNVSIFRRKIQQFSPISKYLEWKFVQLVTLLNLIMNLNNCVMLDITCNHENFNKRFGGTYQLHLQCLSNKRGSRRGHHWEANKIY